MNFDEFFKKYIGTQNPIGTHPWFIWLLFLSFLGMTIAFNLCLIERGTSVIDASVLFRDPNAIANNPPYYGLFSNIGVLFWTISAAISLLTGHILYTQKKDYSGFFILAGTLSAVLGLDDLFMIHEAVLPSIGLPEITTYVFEFILLITLLWTYHVYILRNFWLPLFFSLSALSLSVLLDALVPPFRAETTIEDSIKFIGIVFWAFYFIAMSKQELKATKT